MFGSTALEVAIGVIFLFFILSLLVSSAREILEGWLQSRAIHLERGIRELLRDKAGTGLTKKMYEHPLIASLYQGDYDPSKLRRTLFRDKEAWGTVPFRSNLPAYIPSRSFAVALLDLSGRGEVESEGIDSGPVTFDQIRSGLAANLVEPRVQRAVLVALDQAKGDLEQARANIEAWYDGTMDRVSGWYRKQTQWILLGMGLVAAVGLNIDTIGIAKSLYQNDAVRSVIVAEAEATVQRVASGAALDAEALGCPRAEDQEKGKSCAQDKLEKLPYPMGWSEDTWPTNKEKSFPWSSIPGWLITALAITLGAPFWFDLLNKIMVIRSTVKPHEKSPEESSEDRQIRPIVTGRPLPAAAGDAGTGATEDRPRLHRAADDPQFEPHEWTDRTDPEEGDL